MECSLQGNTASPLTMAAHMLQALFEARQTIESNADCQTSTLSLIEHDTCATVMMTTGDCKSQFIQAR